MCAPHHFTRKHIRAPSFHAAGEADIFIAYWLPLQGTQAYFADNTALKQQLHRRTAEGQQWEC